MYLKIPFFFLYLQFKQTALHIASESGDKDIVTLLLDRGADTESQDEVRTVAAADSNPVRVWLPCIVQFH